MSTPPDSLAADPFTSSFPDQPAAPQQSHTPSNEKGLRQKGTGAITTGPHTAATAKTSTLLRSRSYPPMANRNSSSDHPRDLHFPFLSPFRHPPSPSSDTSPASFSRLLRTFDDSLRTRLCSLLPVPATTTTLSYLSRAVEVLRSAHADAARVISDPSLRGSDNPAVSSYLDSSAALLDSCNAASARIDRLLRRRLFLAVALHHLLLSQGPDTERIQKARKAVAEWERETDAAASRTGGGSIKAISCPRLPPPPGKSSAIARAVYAVEVVSALVGGMLLGSLFGAGSVRVGTVPPEFGWADSYNDLRNAFSSPSLQSCLPAEVSAVQSRASELARALRDGNIRPAAEALQEELETMTEGLDSLAGAINGLFRAAMGARNTAVEGLHLVRKNCNSPLEY